MNIDAIAIGKNPPDDLNVIIEVPIGGEPIKYEIDKASGALFVDRFLYTPMRYPGNYGFVPHTLCGDGDPLDVLVLNSRPLVPGAVIRCRPVGVLYMEDDGGQDEKILAVPVSKLTPMYDGIKDVTDLQPLIIERVKHFFTHYKDLEQVGEDQRCRRRRRCKENHPRLDREGQNRTISPSNNPLAVRQRPEDPPIFQEGLLTCALPELSWVSS
jgi:inorganic pyrophosphatase